MHIGELARRTGLSVKTVRYYSDLGLVPEFDRTLSGYRRYDADAVIRLEFVRTLRDLGLDLATIRRVLERDSALPAVVRDEDFRGRLREMGRHHWGTGTDTGPAAGSPSTEDWTRLAALVAEKAAVAVEAGVEPGAPEAEPVVAELAGAFAAASGRTDDPAYRRELAERLEHGNDPRAERYWQLMAAINGWPPIPTTAHLWTWFASALRACALRASADR